MTAHTFDLSALVARRSPELFDLHAETINPAYVKVLRTIGFDRPYLKGQGAYLFDDRGQRYIDCMGGYAVFALGRNHPGVRDAIKQAMDLDLPSLPGIGPFRLAGMLAEELLKIAPGNFGKVFFASGGGEAVDAAIKMARGYTGREGLLYCTRAYHGLTIGALSVTGNHEFRDGLGDMLRSSTEIPFNDLNALESELKKGTYAAFIVEPIQGKGINIPSDEYLRRVRELCTRYGTLMILDEIQAGLGRCGAWFASEHFGAGRGAGQWQADIVLVAKALSGGFVPTSAVICTDEVHRSIFSSMNNCSRIQNTFSMNDLSMAAGLATLHYMRQEQTVQKCAAVGQRLMEKIREKLSRFEMFKEVRGKGLYIAVEFHRPRSMALKLQWDMIHKLDPSLFCQAILMPLLSEHRILAQVAGHRLDVIKLSPALVFSDQDAEEVAGALEQTVEQCHRLTGPLWQVGKKLAEAKLKPAGV
ncbi:MAG: aspartate aminotransferase family protein [Phycisphaerales bacterium]|nr:aspartate aminotransferase family protein [Phycisphaerales bacterium]